MISWIENTQRFSDRVAIQDETGFHSFERLLNASSRAAGRLLGGQRSLSEERIAFGVRPGFAYAATQWAIWRAGGVAVPLCPEHPLRELEHVLRDCGARRLIVDRTITDFAKKAAELNEQWKGAIELVELDDLLSKDGAAQSDPLPDVRAEARAMILYTSGTTGKPKGVVSTHANIQAQIDSLTTAWKWNSADWTLHVLPLHHTHGIINILACALASGARVEFLRRFDPYEVWRRLASGDISVFMAVPTIYHRLIENWSEAPEDEKTLRRLALRGLRLMVSGSAALPVPVCEKWRKISGHALLERYGMTEIGMALSNPYEGERKPGHVGRPLPSVEVRLMGEDGKVIDSPELPGEIQIRGPTVFLEYWRRPQDTQDAFTTDGWFKTGDVAMRTPDGDYRILGRKSVDIIKSGGYKISALEIEEALLTHPRIRECAVVGIEDAQWGERVAAAVVVSEGETPSIESLNEWAKRNLARYKVPTLWRFVDALPRNAMGKVQKTEVKAIF